MREEPRSMTPVDVMALVAGAAIGLTSSFRGRAIVGGFPYVVPEPWVMLVFLLAWVFWMGAASTSVVVGARLVRYRRFPRPAEWLAILLTLIGHQAMAPMQPIDTLTGSLPFGMMGALDTFAGWRWTTAGLAAGVVALGLGLLHLLRRRLPPWAMTAGLVAIAYLTLAGPISTIGTDGALLLGPSGGFGPGRLSMLHWFACE